MFHYPYYTRVAVTLVVTTIGVGCSSEPQDVVSDATWVATLDHGDKPGNGYELIVRDGRVIAGAFYLLDPNKPHDLNSAPVTAPFSDVKQSGAQVTFSFTLRDGEGGNLHFAMTIILLKKLVGDTGAKVRAKAQDNASDSEAQDLVFVRRK